MPRVCSRKPGGCPVGVETSMTVQLFVKYLETPAEPTMAAAGEA